VTEASTYEQYFAAALYGSNHPYAQGALTVETMGKMHRDLVMDWARTHIVPKNATLVIAGHFDPELVKKHVAFNADQVAPGADSPDAPPLDIVADSHVVRGIESRPSATVELDLGFASGQGLDFHYAKRLVLAAILDSKLSRLRSKDAVTYGFSASYEPRRARGAWRIGGEADANRAADAAKALLDVIDEIRRDPESYRREFVLARQKVIERLLVTASDSHAVMNQLTLLAQFDLADDFFDDLVGVVANLTLKDMTSFVPGELAADGQVFGAFGNADAVDAALAPARARAR
jgi:predicted Zn-dependent peptidase